MAIELHNKVIENQYISGIVSTHMALLISEIAYPTNKQFKFPAETSSTPVKTSISFKRESILFDIV